MITLDETRARAAADPLRACRDLFAHTEGVI